jgi:transcriptional regulator with XRE-family HTH domain
VARPRSEASGKTGSAELARRIQDRRHQLGISRQELAEETGIPYSTLAQIETAYRGVSPSRLGVIARALQLDPKNLYDLLTRDSPLSAPAASGDRAVTPRRAPAAWHANPSFAAALPPAPELVADRMRTAEVSPSDIVDEVVELLSELPADQRLDALGRVQSRLLAGLVQEELQRAAPRQQ